MRGISSLLFPAGPPRSVVHLFLLPGLQCHPHIQNTQLQSSYVKPSVFSFFFSFFSVVFIVPSEQYNAVLVCSHAVVMFVFTNLDIRCSGTSTPLSAEALSAQNAIPSAVDKQWMLEEAKRIARLQEAAYEMGFDLPPQCYRR